MYKVSGETKQNPFDRCLDGEEPSFVFLGFEAAAAPSPVGLSRPRPLRGPIGFAVGRHAGRKLLLLAYAQLRIANAQLLN
jgi:hypothetical protein